MAVDNIIVIGASTGGPRALPELLGAMPALPACLVLVQHMPQYINQSFVNTLRRYTPMPIALAQTNDRLQPGTILVAPSGVHCRIQQNKRIVLAEGPLVNYVRPAIDVTMQSLLPPAGLERILGVVLTGMGCDGAAGLSHIKNLGGITLAQNFATCAVFGMPGEAIKTGHVDYVLPPAEIGRKLAHLIG
jgi:two-component system chemotaxis response regulator CheB